MDAFDLSKLVITPDVNGKIGVWNTSTPFPAPVPLDERDLIRLVWQLAEEAGSIRIFATNEQCRAWLAGTGADADPLADQHPKEN
jgi:hypothetical protein